MEFQSYTAVLGEKQSCFYFFYENLLDSRSLYSPRNLLFRASREKSPFPLVSAFAEEKGQTQRLCTHPGLIAFTTVTFTQGQKQPVQWKQKEQGNKQSNGDLEKHIGRDTLSGNSWGKNNTDFYSIISSLNNNSADHRLCLLPCTTWGQGVAKLKLGPEGENSWKAS